MTKDELATEAWKAWVKDKPFQSEETAKGFMEGFNFCLRGKIKIEGGDKGELISENFSLQDKFTKAKEIIIKLVDGVRLLDDPKVELTDCDDFLAGAEQFLKEGC